MLFTTLHLSFLLLFHLLLISTAAYVYNATEDILLDCGASSNSPLTDRNWQTDTNSVYLPPNVAAISNASQTSDQIPSDKVPYATARIFHSPFTYTFSNLSKGPKFIRLYLYPSTYNSLQKQDSFFSVTANDFTLLRNFSAFLNLDANHPTLMKEYVVNVQDDLKLTLTFSPSPNSYAFVNGIELVSMPDTLYYPGEDVPLKLVSQNSNPFYIQNTMALETSYRLNVGAAGAVNPTKDTGTFREWDQDGEYVIGDNGAVFSLDSSVNYSLPDTPPYTAPPAVYTSLRFVNPNYSVIHNLTWRFPIDSGFYYLVRFHFCLFFPQVFRESSMLFNIYVADQIAEESADVFHWGDKNFNVAIKKDYVAYTAATADEPDGSRRKQDLFIILQPRTDSLDHNNAILNGLEIFKLSNINGNSLAAPNPPPLSTSSLLPTTPPEKKKNKSNSLPWIILSVVGGVALFLSFIAFLIFRRRNKKVKESAASVITKSSWGPISDKSTASKASTTNLPSDLCRRFSLDEIKSATGGFDENFVVGRGGFGNVYKGYIDNASSEVAIKRLKESSNQGIREFLTEIDMLSKLRHVHLVSLIGYCHEESEMILVYDYMARGTLRDHLYKTQHPPLPWKQRLRICIGAAKGLQYLHTSAKQTIIHRDVKSTNILLDEKWAAKVSDFGLSKMGPVGGDAGDTHVTTVVKGSVGYVDPEYYRRQQLTEKSDVYSFGVVLLEVLSARPAIVPNLPKEQVNLAEWARLCHARGNVHQIVDVNLRDEGVAKECLHKYVEIAIGCLKDSGSERPAMGDIVWGLEFALQLQVAAEERGFSVVEEASEDDGDGYAESLSSLPTSTTNDEYFFSKSGEGASMMMSKSSGNFTSSSEGYKSDTVFSEIIRPSAR